MMPTKERNKKRIQRRRPKVVAGKKRRKLSSCLMRPWASSTKTQWCRCNTTRKECITHLGCHLIQECIPISRCHPVCQCTLRTNTRGLQQKRRGTTRVSSWCHSLPTTSSSRSLVHRI